VSRRRLPEEDWPSHDRSAKDAACAKAQRFHRGPAAHWAPTTCAIVFGDYGRFLGYVAKYEPEALTEDPVDRLTIDRLMRYRDHLAESAGSIRQHIYFAKLRSAIQVMFPGRVPEHLSQMVAWLARERRPQAKPWVTTPQLTALGLKLMKQSVRKDGQVRKIAFRDGLMIMLLACRPIRRRAFAAMRIGVHVFQVGNEWRLRFQGSETKSGRPFEASVPDNAVPFLEHFLREVRPMFLAANDHDALWVSSKGHPLTADGITSSISWRTAAAFGQPISPHRFRHCAATTIALFNPNEIELASGILDHASIDTTNKHYILARSIEASRQYAN
jgi:integrase/recombinase XerD